MNSISPGSSKRQSTAVKNAVNGFVDNLSHVKIFGPPEIPRSDNGEAVSKEEKEVTYQAKVTLEY
jgi:hypothetical protein